MILLTGATGCIGGRLLAALEARGHAVRCMTRRPAPLRAGNWLTKSFYKTILGQSWPW